MPTNTPPIATNGNNNNNNVTKDGDGHEEGSNTMLSSWTTWFDELSDRQRLDRLRSCSELDQILKNCQENSAKQRRTHLDDKNHHHHQQQKQVKTAGNRWSLWNRSSQSQQQQQQQQVPVTTAAGDDAQDTNGDGLSQVDLIERTSQGIRSMKYFGWRGVLSSNSDSSSNESEPAAGGSKAYDKNRKNDADNDETNEKNNVNRMIRQSCSREQHAVWACRAVATGCGHDLSLLKTCFEKGGGIDDGGISGDGNRSSGDDGQRRTFSTTDILTTRHTAYHLGGGGGSVKLTSKKNDGTINNNIPCYDQQVRLGHCVTAQAQALLERKRRREGTGGTKQV